MRRLLLTAIVTTAAALVVGGCAGQAHVDQDGDGTAHVNVSVLPIANVAPLYLGIEKGFFRQERLDVKPQIAQTGAATIAAVVSGKNQFGYTTTTSHVQAAAKGLPLRAVAAAAVAADKPQDSFAGLMVKGDGPIRDPKQLAGTIDGVRGQDPTPLEMARAYGIGGFERVRRIVLPAAAPQIFAGLRTSLSIALILMVISEMVASTNGIGNFVLQSQRTFAIPEMWAGILLLGLLGIALSLIFGAVERRVLRWHRGARQAARAR